MSFVKKSKNQELAIDTQKCVFCEQEEEEEVWWAGPVVFSLLTPLFSVYTPWPIYLIFIIFDIFIFYNKNYFWHFLYLYKK